MIYSEPLSNQISLFLDSVGMGFLLCGLYIAVKVLFRIFGKGRIAVMLSDGTFCILVAFVSFFYMIMKNSGTVRFNLAVGQLMGGLLLYFTFGRVIIKLLYLIADGVNGMLGGITYPLRFIVNTIIFVPARLFKRCRGAKREKDRKNVDKKIKLL